MLEATVEKHPCCDPLRAIYNTSTFVGVLEATGQAMQAVAYIRVSTQGQGRSGLGLEAQREAIARFAEAEGYEVAETFKRSRRARARMRSTADRSSRPPSRPPGSSRARSLSRSSTGSPATCISSRG